MILHKNNNFIGLLAGQLVLIFTTPFLHLFDETVATLILHMAIIGMMAFALLGNQGNKQWYKSIIILSAIEVLIFVLAIALNEVLLTYIAISLLLFFLATSIAVAFNSVFSVGKSPLTSSLGPHAFTCCWALSGLFYIPVCTFFQPVHSVVSLT